MRPNRIGRPMEILMVEDSLSFARITMEALKSGNIEHRFTWLSDGGEALEFLHRIGKFRLAHSPWTNHSWHTTLYVTARGLTTSPISFGSRIFSIEFDFIDHRLLPLLLGNFLDPWHYHLEFQKTVLEIVQKWGILFLPLPLNLHFPSFQGNV